MSSESEDSSTPEREGSRPVAEGDVGGGSAGSGEGVSSSGDGLESGDDGESGADIMTILNRMDLDRKRAQDAYEENIARPEYDENLREALSILSTASNFSRGDLVQWKKFMRTSLYPHSGAPAIVVRFLEDPVLVSKDGLPLTEPRDVVLGFLDGDNDFVTGHFVSSRFMRWD